MFVHLKKFSMTEREIKEEYSKLFVLVMEDAADESGNLGYKNAQKVAEGKIYFDVGGKFIDILDADIVSLGEYIMCLIAGLLTEVLGPSILEEESSDKIKLRIEDLYSRYLLKPTRLFTQKYGLAKIPNILGESGYISYHVNPNSGNAHITRG